MEPVMLLRPDGMRQMFSEMEERLTKIIIEAVKPQSEPEQKISQKEASAFMRCSVRTLRRRFAAGVYPLALIHYDAGKPGFYKSELSKYQKTKQL
jgi:hypothetical protein